MVASRDDHGRATLFATMCTAMELVQETCALMALVRLARLARACVAVLDRLQSGEMEPRPRMMEDLLSTITAIDDRLSNFTDAGEALTAAVDDEELIARLARWRGPGAMAPSHSATVRTIDESEANAMLLDEIRERICELALVTHYLSLFPWHVDDRACGPPTRLPGTTG